MLTAYLATVAVLAAHLPLSPWTLLPGAIVIGGGLWALLSRLGLHLGLPSVLLALVLMAGCVVAASLVYDTSCDGQTYHQEAIVHLHDRWNPYNDPSDPSNPWVRHYPKASWLIAVFSL